MCKESTTGILMYDILILKLTGMDFSTIEYKFHWFKFNLNLSVGGGKGGELVSQVMFYGLLSFMAFRLS